jgi:hypothetical protein
MILRLALKKDWVMGELPAISSETEQERGEEELRAHAID